MTLPTTVCDSASSMAATTSVSGIHAVRDFDQPAGVDPALLYDAEVRSLARLALPEAPSVGGLS
jgi:hypothetical protein